jgi:hypothetical protein
VTGPDGLDADGPTVAVPPPIEVGDRLVGPLSPRQTGWLMVSGLAVLLALTGAGPARAALGAGVAALTLAPALLRPAGRSPEAWLVVLARYQRRRHRRRVLARGPVRRSATVPLVVSLRPHRRWRLAAAVAALVTVGALGGVELGDRVRPARPPAPPPGGAGALDQQLARAFDALLGSLPTAAPSGP